MLTLPRSGLTTDKANIQDTGCAKNEVHGLKGYQLWCMPPRASVDRRGCGGVRRTGKRAAAPLARRAGRSLGG